MTQQQPGEIPIPRHPEPIDPPVDPNGPRPPLPQQEPPVPHPYSPPPTRPEPSDPRKAPVITPGGVPETPISKPPRFPARRVMRRRDVRKESYG